MKRERTIAQAVQIVLEENNKAMTYKDICNEIIKKNLYQFNTNNPASVVCKAIRDHCVGKDYPSASPMKYFVVVDGKGAGTLYFLNNGQVTLSQDINDNDKLPEEIIMEVHKKHVQSVSERLFDLILAKPPEFFEHLIVDLLIKMNYGYDSSSGIAIGKSHDGGIDGVINEDKLGLDRIYLQAKRYKPGNKVGSKELQAFVGAMMDVTKGVFITTSSFTREALDYAAKQQIKRLRLIDGSMLMNYMIMYQVGVNQRATIPIYAVDENYFEI